MTMSTLEPRKTRTRHSVCPHCGRALDSPTWLSIFLGAGLNVLAVLVLTIMLVPLGIMAWKSCSAFLFDRVSHSIFFHPLEDWTRY